MRGISDPAWKSGPKEQKPTDSEHELDPASAGIDIDGVGVDEAKRVDGTPITTTMESFGCLRDMCDATEKRRHIYVLEDVADERLVEVSEQFGWTDTPDDEDLVEYIASRVKVVDYDEAPVLGFTDGSEGDMYLEARLTITDEARGACYGEPDRPDPEPYDI